jgi:RimJ/RimL family protein N-acetyltransferase
MFDVRLTKANLFHFISNKNILWMNDIDIVKNLTFRGKFTRFKALQYFLSNRQNILLAIYVNNIYVGNCGFYNILNNSSEFRIVFGEKKLWGKGLSKIMLNIYNS